MNTFWQPACFICQDYKANIGHETKFCPRSKCKHCGQKGHFRMNCVVKLPWLKSNPKNDSIVNNENHFEVPERPYEYELTTEVERMALLNRLGPQLQKQPPKLDVKQLYTKLVKNGLISEKSEKSKSIPVHITTTTEVLSKKSAKVNDSESTKKERPQKTTSEIEAFLKQ